MNSRTEVDGFTGILSHFLKNTNRFKALPILKRTLHNSGYETDITFMPKPDKDITSKEAHSPIFPLNTLREHEQTDSSSI